MAEAILPDLLGGAKGRERKNRIHMPRLSALGSKEVRESFAPWFREALVDTGLTLSAIVYSTRPHVESSGTEISHSNLKKIASGKSAPSFETALRIIEMLSKTNRMKMSMLTGLMASYPHALARVVIGLDVIGLDLYWEIRKVQPQLKRKKMRMRFQKAIGVRGNKAISQQYEFERGQHIPSRELLGWINEIAGHCDLFAILLAYAFFSCSFGDDCALYLKVALSQYDQTREFLYWEALRRYIDFKPQDYHLAGPELHKAERALADYTNSMIDRIEFASAFFSRWAGNHAEQFIAAIPLLDWVDSDIIRYNLDQCKSRI